MPMYLISQLKLIYSLEKRNPGWAKITSNPKEQIPSALQPFRLTEVGIRDHVALVCTLEEQVGNFASVRWKKIRPFLDSGFLELA